MLSEIDLMEIRHTLEQERTRLLGEVEVRVEQDESDREELNPDRTDLAGDYVSRDRRSALLSIEVEMLHQVERALERLNGGRYGFCQECGEEIDPERLKALPDAPLCMACQQAAATAGHHR